MVTASRCAENTVPRNRRNTNMAQLYQWLNLASLGGYNRPFYNWDVRAADTEKSRRRYQSRSQSMEALRRAALDVLLTEHPDDVTIRQIGDLADVAHTYIPQYFGGKSGLFADIYPMAAEAAAAVVVMPVVPLDAIKPELTRLARLALWLSSHHPLGIPSTERLLAAALSERVKSTFELDERTCELVVERLIAMVVVFAGAPTAVSPKPIDLAAHIELELRLLSTLQRSS